MKARIFLISLFVMVFGIVTHTQAQTQDIKFINKWQNYSKTVTSANIYCTGTATVQLSVGVSWFGMTNPGSKYVFNLNNTVVNIAYGYPYNGGSYSIDLKAGMNYFQIDYTGPLNLPSYGSISIIKVSGYPIVSNEDTKLVGGPWE